MGDNYLENLPLSDEEKAKIAALGATSAAALLAMMRAAPEAFNHYLGSDFSQELAAALEASISDRERAILNSAPQKFNATGAIIGKEPPEINSPPYDIAERERLFNQLQSLRQQYDSSPETKRRIAELEDQLNTLLESS